MEEKIGVVEDYFAKISVIAVKLEDELKVVNKIHIKVLLHTLYKQ
jgi:hypothetical protein